MTIFGEVCAKECFPRLRFGRLHNTDKTRIKGELRFFFFRSPAEHRKKFFIESKHDFITIFTFNEVNFLEHNEHQHEQPKHGCVLILIDLFLLLSFQSNIRVLKLLHATF